MSTDYYFGIASPPPHNSSCSLRAPDLKGRESESKELSSVSDKWNIARANQLLSAVLAEIDELGDKLSPARAEALLNEFEHDIK